MADASELLRLCDEVASEYDAGTSSFGREARIARALKSRLQAEAQAPAPRMEGHKETRKRREDEALLTHQIRCYSEYVRNVEDHGPNRSEIANILSCHAPYINEYIDRLSPPSTPGNV